MELAPAVVGWLRAAIAVAALFHLGVLLLMNIVYRLMIGLSFRDGGFGEAPVRVNEPACKPDSVLTRR